MHLFTWLLISLADVSRCRSCTVDICSQTSCVLADSHLTSRTGAYLNKDLGGSSTSASSKPHWLVHVLQ